MEYKNTREMVILTMDKMGLQLYCKGGIPLAAVPFPTLYEIRYPLLGSNRRGWGGGNSLRLRFGHQCSDHSAVLFPKQANTDNP